MQFYFILPLLSEYVTLNFFKSFFFITNDLKIILSFKNAPSPKCVRIKIRLFHFALDESYGCAVLPFKKIYLTQSKMKKITYQDSFITSSVVNWYISKCVFSKMFSRVNFFNNLKNKFFTENVRKIDLTLN